MADADLDLAVEGILWSAFGTTGQRCTACSGVVVDEVGRRRAGRVGSWIGRRNTAPGLGPRADDRCWPADQRGRAVEKVEWLRGRRDGGGRPTDRGGSQATGDGLQHGHFF